VRIDVFLYSYCAWFDFLNTGNPLALNFSLSRSKFAIFTLTESSLGSSDMVRCKGNCGFWGYVPTLSFFAVFLFIEFFHVDMRRFPDHSPSLPHTISTFAFSSSSATAGYCSQCFKTKNGAAATPAKAAAASAGPGSPSLPPLHSSASSAASMAAASASSASSSASGAAAGGKEVQANRSRCWKCKKKVGLLGFHCPCDYSFCSKCRYPEEHSCPHDFMKGMSLLSFAALPLFSRRIVPFILDFNRRIQSSCIWGELQLFNLEFELCAGNADGRAKLAKENQKVEASKLDRID
jgi:hypothetical protein